MTTVYIDHKGASLDLDGAAAVVRGSDGRLGTLPLAAIDRLVLRGAGSVSTRLLGALWSRRISLVVLGGRHSEVIAMMHGAQHGDAQIRLGQYALHGDEAERGRRARRLIAAKLGGQRRVLADAADERPDCRHPLLTAVAGIDRLLAELDDPAPAGLSRIMGIEGAAAAAYFAGFGALFPPSLGFDGRNRRPPRDPVNACLSLGYTLLHADAVRASRIAGLDPLLGVFHQPLPGRESLACDLVEPLRPRLDRWVWTLFRDRVLRAAHFSTTGGACLLGKAGRRHFYEGYETAAAPWRRLLRRMCQSLVRDLRGGVATPEP